MSTKTKLIGLEKPDSNDFYDISVFNNNFDMLDHCIAQHDDYLSGDMNNMTTLGLWSTNGNYNPSTPSGHETWNMPDGLDGWNVVLILNGLGDCVIQILMNFNDTSKTLYQRGMFNGIWSDWHKLSHNT